MNGSPGNSGRIEKSGHPVVRCWYASSWALRSARRTPATAAFFLRAAGDIHEFKRMFREPTMQVAQQQQMRDAILSLSRAWSRCSAPPRVGAWKVSRCPLLRFGVVRRGMKMKQVEERFSFLPAACSITDSFVCFLRRIFYSLIFLTSLLRWDFITAIKRVQFVRLETSKEHRSGVSMRILKLLNDRLLHIL